LIDEFTPSNVSRLGLKILSFSPAEEPICPKEIQNEKRISVRFINYSNFFASISELEHLF